MVESPDRGFGDRLRAGEGQLIDRVSLQKPGEGERPGLRDRGNPGDRERTGSRGCRN